MRRAGLVLHADRPQAEEIGRWLASSLASRGVSVYALPADAGRAGPPVEPVDAETFERGFDIIFVLGGDGTFLRAAELAYRSGTPLLGVNLGRLGFLAAIERGGLERAIDRILGEGFAVSERMTIEGRIEVGGVVAEHVWALNDVIISKLSPGRLIRVGAAIGDETFTVFAADGVVVATPTGSTAYSFSTRGPIVDPALDCLILTPVSPHMLFDRAVVVDPAETISITVLDDPDAVALSADGRKWVELPTGSTVRLRRGSTRIRLAMVESAPFWRLVRQKFHLPVEP